MSSIPRRNNVKFVFMQTVNNQSHFMWMLVFGKGVFCHFTRTEWTGTVEPTSVTQSGDARLVVCFLQMIQFCWLPQNLASNTP